MRLKARIDQNHNEIVDALRAVGCSVQSLAACGKGIPDILVGRSGKNWLIEIKSEKGKLTFDQETWHSRWKGTVHVCRTVNDAIETVRLYSEVENRARKWKK